MQISVSIKGLPELERSLKRAGKTMNELVEEALTKGSDRMTRKSQGGGLGASRNVVQVRNSMAMSREVTTSLNWPRTRGTSWLRYFAHGRTIRLIFANVINKRKRQLEQEWGR